MPHFATKNHTLQFSKRFPDLRYNQLGSTGLTVSSAGFGTYRVHISVDEHRQALTQALKNGINLIDSSSNYADGGSEELVGSVIKNLADNKELKRQEIVIVSKAGYLQGKNYAQSQQLKAQGNPYPDLVEYTQGLEHCIHPQFLEDQLTQSLLRLKLDSIDVYLLHNPEYYLLWAHNNGIALIEAQAEFYRRIEQAFMHLEIEAQNGRIQYYGISSNTFPASAKVYGFVDLHRIWDIAESISKDHKFRVVQFPLNLIENGAILEINQTTKQSVLDFATGKSLGVLVNRPLNAFSNNQLNRLVSIVIDEKHDPKSLNEKFDKIVQLEVEFVDEILPMLNLDESSQKNLTGLFSSATYLKSNWQKLGPYWTWLDSQAQYLTDQVSYGVQLLNDAADKSNQTVKWLDNYVELFNDMLGNLTLYYGEVASKTSIKILDDFKQKNPQFSDIETLQQLALATLFLTEGVSSTLIGMRRSEYVNDVLNSLKESSQLELDQSFWA